MNVSVFSSLFVFEFLDVDTLWGSTPVVIAFSVTDGFPKVKGLYDEGRQELLALFFALTFLSSSLRSSLFSFNLKEDL